jgi:hypothetical protein
MKTTINIILAVVFSTCFCSMASAQLTPGVIKAMQNGLRPNVGAIPTQAAPMNFTPGVIKAMQNGLRPQLGLSPAPGSGAPIPIPPGPLREFNPSPSPTPQPQRPGVNFNLGPGGPSLGIPLGGGNRLNVPLPGQRFRQRPMFQPPGYQTPTQVLGYGPNGEVYTGNGQVAGSAYTPGRNLSQHNGTQRVVQRPIYDNFGNVVGYQEGTVWNNSLTGQEHGNMTTYTPNGSGGSHQSTTLYSTAGGNMTPIGN